MEITVHEQATALMRAPGNRLTFIDDTELHGTDVPSMAPDLRILTAVTFQSERYPALEQAIGSKLALLGCSEFHAANIVNPKNDSPWKARSMEERIEALRFLASMVQGTDASMAYAQISTAQWKEMRRAWQDDGNPDFGLSRDAALKRVVLRSVADEAMASGKPSMVMIDQDKDRDNIELDASEGLPWLLGGGVLTAPSQRVAGLQLADALAFATGRFLRRRDQIAAGAAFELDNAVAEIVAALDGRGRSLLNSAPADAATQAMPEPNTLDI